MSVAAGVATALLVLAGPAFADPTPAATATDGPFTMKLTRPWHVGDTVTERIYARQSREVTGTLGGRVFRHVQTYRELVAVVRTHVVSASVRQRTAHLHVQILSLEGRTARDARRTPQSLGGVGLEVTWNPKLTVVRTDGKHLTESELPYVDLLCRDSASDERGAPDSGDDRGIDGETDDAIFGPSGPVRIGDTWTADTEKMAAFLSGRGALFVSMNDMATLFSLDARKMVNGVDCLILHGSVDSNHIAPRPGESLRMHDISGKLHGEFAYAVPVDTKKRVMRSGADLEMTLSGKIDLPQGGIADVLVQMTQQGEATTLPDSGH